MTSVREFAERVLFGASLSDKLLAAGTLNDDARGQPLLGTVLPTRPTGLAIAESADAFPSDTALAEAGARGRALHFFANHELLALELMALALLRFVDAPPAFRRGLVATIVDEQRHLSLYLERMQALGVGLGEVGMGGFFWRALADTQSPAHFVAAMSLTFEQANLDHSRHYADLFAARGDAPTAAIMEEVYADEVRHVRLGVHWFQRWHPDEPLLDAHRDALVPPMDLGRARGRTFDLAGRTAAGLPTSYIEAIANVPRARGKPPVVHLFDPSIETALVHGDSFNPDAATRTRTADLQSLPLLYAAPEDVVLVRERPSEAFVAGLTAAGFSVAETVATDLEALRIDVPRLTTIEAVRPWGWTPRLAQRLRRLRVRARDQRVPERGWPAELFDKARGATILRRVLSDNPDAFGLGSLADVGVEAQTPEAVHAVLVQIHGRGFATAALKAPLGTAGRGTIRARVGEWTDAQAGWVRNTLKHQGHIVVEPWLDRVCDLSLRLSIDTPGEASIDDVGRFLVNDRGQYLGAVIGKPTVGLPSEVIRFMHGDGQHPRWLDSVWATVAREVAREMQPSGYVGTVGVDALIHRTTDGLRLRPVVELNPRVHMGHVAMHLRRRLAGATVGIWRLCRIADLVRRGYADAVDYATRRRAEHPLVRDAATGGIRRGVVITNDPARATEVLGVFAVAATLPDAIAMLDAADPNGN